MSEHPPETHFPVTPTYEYLAFISYSRMDSSQARWLHRELESYRFPAAMVPLEYHPPHKTHLRPIVRDKFSVDVNAEDYWEDIKEKIDRSRFLIVLCSQNSVGSTILNKEIVHFLKRPDAQRYLIPVILNGSPGKGGAEECFPPALREISDTLLSRNLPTMIPDKGAPLSEGLENGLFQTISYLLHVEQNKIAEHYYRIKRRELKRHILFVMILLFFYTLITSWAIFAERRATQNTKIAVEALEEAERQRQRAEAGEKKAVEALEEAERQRQRAEAGEKKAVEALEEIEKQRQRAEEAVRYATKQLIEKENATVMADSIARRGNVPLMEIEELDPEIMREYHNGEISFDEAVKKHSNLNKAKQERPFP